MAQRTALSVTATSGRTQSFLAKTAAAGAKGTGPFTELSVQATPGARRNFNAKANADGKGAGPFTELSVMALPGRMHAFAAKTASTGDAGARIPGSKVFMKMKGGRSRYRRGFSRWR